MDFFLCVCETSRVGSSGTTKVHIRQFQQLYTCVTGRFMDSDDAREVYKYHDNVLVPQLGLWPPNTDGKPVVGIDELRVILTFNLAYDTSIFSTGLQRVWLHGYYVILSYTGVRPAELVDGGRKRPKDGSLDELFGQKVVIGPANGDDGSNTDKADVADDEEATDDDPKRLNELLSRETTGRGRPKALCYENILMMIVCHPVTGKAIPTMAIKFIHLKGADEKSKPAVFYFSPTKKLILCAITVMMAHALRDHAFDAPSLTNAARVLRAGPAFTKCTPLRREGSMLKTPVFRRFGFDGVLSETEAMLYNRLRSSRK
ncbi:hypothetical protein GGS23DRAFT_594281 [Durotheca rogersii]|uniref:uncharacterized protein n=1 Tax=Durotheca rogersii TaxID=419775 RepID=UPI00221EA804|nr:uncharacterized protein GGS23DRAFT_594281 [Durotheca rogersii]KAI5866135.1 hypothetical protein GGS23DRAFT_594281 [Durotheca rogersii]